MDNINIQDLIDVNLYEILNVDIDSNESEIKKQYKKLILKYHPDKNPDNEDVFELITLSYNIIINKELRKLYNEIRKNKYQSDFVKLKKESFEIKLPDLPKKNFNLLNEEYNKLHGYNSKEKILKIEEFNKKLHELIEERKKEVIKYKKLSDKEFKNEFDNIKRDDNLSNELIPYNVKMILLNGINQISKLYDTGESEINKRFLLNNLSKYDDNQLPYDEQIKKYYNTSF
jgi:curved DNA-binding protein CbpA